MSQDLNKINIFKQPIRRPAFPEFATQNLFSHSQVIIFTPPLTFLASPLPPPAIRRGLTSRSPVCPGCPFLASRGAGSRLCALRCASSLSMAAGSASGLFADGRDSARSVEVRSAESLVRWRSRLREPAHGFSSSSPLQDGVKSQMQRSQTERQISP